MSNTNLPRVTQKVFAQNAEKIGQFGSAKNGSPFPTGDIEQIQALSAWNDGWSAAVVSNRNYPPLEEMTGVQKVFSQQIAYLLEKGMPEWDDGTTYFKDDMCRVARQFYYSLTDNNIGNDPTTDRTNWNIWNPAEGTFANVDLSNLSENGQAVLNAKLNTNQITNCILSDNGAKIETQSYTQQSYVNHGCTVSEAGVASGFSASNYILLSKTMTDADTFVLTIPFKLNSTGTQTLCAINNFPNSISIVSGSLALIYNDLQLAGSFDLQTNTQYYAVLTRTETGYTLELKTSLEGAAVDTISLTSSAGYFGGKSVYIGSDRDSNYLDGEIDLTQLTITTGEETYWSNTTLSDFETVTLSGSLQVLMPNGRNEDLTLKNTSATLTLDGTLLYNNTNGATKTIVVRDDGEIMIRDYYTEGAAANNMPLNGIWLDTENNVMKTQLNTYPNFINNGVTVTDGVVSGFGATTYMQLPSLYTLGSNWNISLDATPVAQDTSCAILGDVSLVSESYIPQGVGVVFDGVDKITAIFRRPDVYNVRKTVVLSTAYEVTKGDQTGYVQTAGAASSYVPADTQVYSDSSFETPLETAAENTWQYTGDTVDNTQDLTGYVKPAGSTLVAADTVVYSDANCTSVQGTASGSDYVYTEATSVSIIGTLEDTITAGSATTITLSYDGANYKLNTLNLASSDQLQPDIPMPLGKAIGENYYQGTINLNNSTFSFWTWNGISETTPDLIPFVGVKIGEVIPSVVNPNISVAGELTNNNGVFSGFSAANYITLTKTFNPGSYPWGMVWVFTTGSNISTQQTIFSKNAYSIILSVMNSKFVLSISANGTSWDIANNKLSTYTVLANTKYALKCAWDGTNYTLSYAVLAADTDIGDVEFIQDFAIANTTPLYFDTTTNNIGLHSSSTYDYPFLGSIDLNESYININGEQWWKWNGLIDTPVYPIGAYNIDKPLQVATKEMLDLLRPVGRPIFCSPSEKLEADEIWLEGAEVSKTAYAELYSVYGDAYGTPANPDNFLLPDYRNRTIWGTPDLSSGYVAPGLPNITGHVNYKFNAGTALWCADLAGSIFASGSLNCEQRGDGGATIRPSGIALDASRQNSVYNPSVKTVQPPSVKVRVKTRYK